MTKIEIRGSGWKTTCNVVIDRKEIKVIQSVETNTANLFTRRFTNAAQKFVLFGFVDS